MDKIRYLASDIAELCFPKHKMAFISGPRQCGKTTLAKHLLADHNEGRYYNWDESKFRRLWAKDPSQISEGFPTNTTPLIVLDEIHKAKSWKRNLKGVYDTLTHAVDIIVTGSARLDIYRKGSDSLQGRYYGFRLHPFSLAELLMQKCNTPEAVLDNLLNHNFHVNMEATKYLQLLDKFGPFPEPLLTADARTLNLWRHTRITKIIREDLRDLSRLPELSMIEMLIALLPERAANVLSIQSLSEDLEVAYTTVKRWLNYLYQLYYAFKLPPYSKSLSRALKKESKLYLWDWSEIEDEGRRFENLIASHLLKYCHYLTDTGIGDFQLYYLRNRQKQEIDFLVVKDKKPWLPIEVKLHDDTLASNWSAFMRQLNCPYGVQVVKQDNVHQVVDTNFGKIVIISAAQFLSGLV